MRKTKAQLDLARDLVTTAAGLRVEGPSAVLPAYDNTALARHQTYWADALAQLADLPCESAEQEAWWAENLNKAQHTFNAIDAERDALVRPLNAEVKDINLAHKPVLTLLEQCKALIASKLSDAATARGRLAGAARGDAAALALAGDSAGCQAALASIPDDLRVEGIATVWSWRVVSTNIEAMSKSFLLPDDKALAAVCKAFKDREDAPVLDGVVFERVAKVQPRGGVK